MTKSTSLSIIVAIITISCCVPLARADNNAAVFNEDWKLKIRANAEKGDPQAQDNLGILYCGGTGIPQDYTKAMQWFHKAAAQGNDDAQLNIGDLYYKGHGVPQNYTEAIKWYRKSADQGNANLQLFLGDLYYRGEIVPKNYAEALKWYIKAANLGNATLEDRPLYELGVMYRDGEGVGQDYIQAYMWLNLAVAHNKLPKYMNDAETRDRLEKKMTPDQISKAQRLSREWKPTKNTP